MSLIARPSKRAAGDKDIKIGGGVSTVRQYLQAGLIDSLHFALAPVAIGQGEALPTGLDLRDGIFCDGTRGHGARDACCAHEKVKSSNGNPAE